jgi:hypothetical protein
MAVISVASTIDLDDNYLISGKIYFSKLPWSSSGVLLLIIIYGPIEI